MARRTPYVVDGALHIPGPGGPGIGLDSASWAAWLTDPATRSFSFRSPSGRYTARKERRSCGGEYWVAYRKRGGKLHKAYLGKAQNVTLARLHEVAAALAGRDGGVMARPPPDTIAGTRGDALLLSRLSIPSVRSALVSRPGLIRRLEEGLGRKLTLVSAPAGFGKSTLLGAWIGGLSGDRPVAWLSLDAADNDPARFWRYFVTAVDRLHPGSADTALALLGSPRASPMEAVLTTLLNELANLDTPTVLILDDFHLIERADIHEALTFLVEHLPSRMHLIVSTRADPPLPLSRLRARASVGRP